MWRQGVRKKKFKYCLHRVPRYYINFGWCICGHSMAASLHKAEGTGPNARQTAAELLPLVYDELRRLAVARLARENSHQNHHSLIQGSTKQL